jgi:uncharacterized delta-60 repeat protein
MLWKIPTTAWNHGRRLPRTKRAVIRRRSIHVEHLEERKLLSGNSFGVQGKVITKFDGATMDSARSVLSQSNGRIVAVGTSGFRFALARYTSSGALDSSFGSGGKVTTGFASSQASVSSAALQQDQKILVAGFASSPILARYTTTGSLDTTFGNGGKTTILAGLDGLDYVTNLPDGEIVVAGTLTNPSTGTGSFVVEEYKGNGALDLSFGINGRVTTDLGGSGQAIGITTQGNNVLVAGYASFSTESFVVARYTPTGTLDQSFGKNGLASYAAGGNVSGVAVGSDGGIDVVGGRLTFSPTFSLSTFVARLTPNGTLDGSFGSGGMATVNGLLAFAIGIQPDGKAVVVGQTADSPLFTQFAVERLTATGAPDSGFGSGGLVTTAITSADDANSVALQGNKIVVAGGGFNSATGNDFALASYTETGALDERFGNGGSVITNFVGEVSSDANSIVSDGDGGFYVAGTSGAAGGSLSVAHYEQDGSLDHNFGNGGKVQVTFNPFIFGARPNDGYVTVQRDGKILLVGTSIEPGSTNYDFAMARLLQDGEFDRTFGDGGKVTTFSGTQFTDMAPSGGVVIQPDGKLLVAGYTEKYSTLPHVDKGVVVRYTRDGSVDTSFGDGGRETIDLSTGRGRMTSMVLEPNGEILLGGFVRNPDTFDENYFLEELQTNGTPDSAFGTAGQMVTGFSGFFDSGAPLLLRPDGEILVGGSTFDPVTFQGFMTVAQFTAAGAVDNSFGANGQASVGFPGEPNLTFAELHNMSLQRDGKVVVVGSFFTFDPDTFASTSSFAMSRFTKAGRIDTQFGDGGTVTTSIAGYQDQAAAVLIQDDGRILVAGVSTDPDTLLDNYAIVEYNSDGTIVTSKDRRRK